MGIFDYLLVQRPEQERQRQQDADLRRMQEAQQGFMASLSGESLADMSLPEVMRLVQQQEQVGLEGGVVQDQLDYLQGLESSRIDRDAAAQQAAIAAGAFNTGTVDPGDYTQDSYASALDVYGETGSMSDAFRQLERVEDPVQPIDPYGPIGSGMMRVPDPATGMMRDIPVPGSREYESRAVAINELSSGIQQADDLMREIDETGGESFGARSKTQSLLFNQLIGRLSSMVGAGVLQPAEFERLASALVDPTDYMSRFRSNTSLKAPYELLRSQLYQKQQEALARMLGQGGVTISPPSPNAPPAPPPGTVPVRR